MRPLSESRQRWAETLGSSNASLADLRRALQSDGPLRPNPCETGLRSVCWKIFLLFREAAPEDRLLILGETRADYTALVDRYMQFVKHPERLTELTVDPLADDPESPWDVFRHDDAVRSEILQDVRRLPDEPFYHQQHIQDLILDVLFIYCKHHPDAGGYRQGMHELLAPLVYVLAQDAVDKDGLAGMAATKLDASDAYMALMLDARYVEHDAYALFAAVMAHAKTFYQIHRQPSPGHHSRHGSLQDSLAADGLYPMPPRRNSHGPTEESMIVEMSKTIHEDTLMKIDPELAIHLKNIEILPQIFLIRWIRLLFGREFPFHQQLGLWDSIFAWDPDLELVPLICVAMLLRIRWELLEADYSVALPLLLKYPPPAPPHGPSTFVDDALFLQDHTTPEGCATLVLQYTGRAPARPPSPRASLSSAGSGAQQTPATPHAGFAAGLGNLRSRTRMAVRSPLQAAMRAVSPGGRVNIPNIAGIADVVETAADPLAHGHEHSPSLSPSRFSNSREGMEALFHGAAKGVLERGQKLGINQAMREAMGEFRRNMMQGLQEVRQAKEGGSVGGTRTRRHSSGQVLQLLAEMERMEQRNQQLASMLDETVASLQSLVTASQKAGAGGEAEGTDGIPGQGPGTETSGAKGPTETPTEAPVDETVKAETGKAETNSVHPPWLDVVEMAAAKVKFVKIHLEDGSLALPTDEERASSTDGATTVTAAMAATAATIATANGETVENGTTANSDGLLPAAHVGEQGKVSSVPKMSPPTKTIHPIKPAHPVHPAPLVQATPTHPLPSRSTLAQSSFAWMLEPNDTPDSPTGTDSRSPPSLAAHNKRMPRGRHAFLFGETVNASPLGGEDGLEDKGKGSGGGGGNNPRRRGSSVSISGGGVGHANGHVNGSARKRSIVVTDEVFGLEPLQHRPEEEKKKPVEVKEEKEEEEKEEKEEKEKKESEEVK